MKESTWLVLKRNIKKAFAMLFLLILIVLSAYIYENYFYTASSGFRTGLLQKFTHYGNTIKTYDGEIILNYGARNVDAGHESENFHFTVTNKKLVNQLDSIQGKMVTVHYKKKNKALFWRGDSPYLVDGLKLNP